MSPSASHPKNPSYRQVCSGSTGHVEVLHLTLTNPDEHYEELLRFFFMFHDPTTYNRQGNDVGSQYSSYVFTHSDSQVRAMRGREATSQEDTLTRCESPPPILPFVASPPCQHSAFWAVSNVTNTKRAVAERVVRELQGHISRGTLSSFEGEEVRTKVGEATVFYPATDDHQAYLEKNPGGYCNHYFRFKAWPMA